MKSVRNRQQSVELTEGAVGEGAQSALRRIGDFGIPEGISPDRWFAGVRTTTTQDSNTINPLKSPLRPFFHFAPSLLCSASAPSSSNIAVVFFGCRPHIVRCLDSLPTYLPA